MANIPTEVTPQVQLIDPRTGQLTKDGLQTLNALIRAVRDHEKRITALE